MLLLEKWADREFSRKSSTFLRNLREILDISDFLSLSFDSRFNVSKFEILELSKKISRNQNSTRENGCNETILVVEKIFVSIERIANA